MNFQISITLNQLTCSVHDKADDPANVFMIYQPKTECVYHAF